LKFKLLAELLKLIYQELLIISKYFDVFLNLCFWLFVWCYK